MSLAYERQSEDDPPGLPSWLLALLDKVRDGRCEQHPNGGMLLLARKAETQEEGEQDLFADDDDLLCATGKEVSLSIHSASVERAVETLAGRCLPDAFHEPLKTAAYWHDVGKLDERFQIMLRQGDELAALTGQALAKSAALPDSPGRRRAIRAASGLPFTPHQGRFGCQLQGEFHFFPRGKPQYRLSVVVRGGARGEKERHGVPFQRRAAPLARLCPIGPHKKKDRLSCRLARAGREIRFGSLLLPRGRLL